MKVYKKLEETVNMTEILEEIDKETSEETRNKVLKRLEIEMTKYLKEQLNK